MKKVIAMVMVMVMVLSVGTQAMAYDYPYTTEEPPVALIKELSKWGFEMTEEDDDQWTINGKFIEEYIVYGIFDVYYNKGVLYGYNFLDDTRVVIEFYWNIDYEEFDSDVEYEW